MSTEFKNRRVVTGHDASGKGIVVSDGPAPTVHTVPLRPGFAINEIWITSGTAEEMNSSGDPTDRPRAISPPPNGTIFRIVLFPPEKNYINDVLNDPDSRAKVHASYSVMGAPGAAVDLKNQPHPFMHKTDTLDYGVVLSGEMHLVMDDTVVLLRPGDSLVQRATNHAWSNRGDVPCVIAFVLSHLKG